MLTERDLAWIAHGGVLQCAVDLGLDEGGFVVVGAAAGRQDVELMAMPAAAMACVRRVPCPR